jgi:hypothetical protein
MLSKDSAKLFGFNSIGLAQVADCEYFGVCAVWWLQAVAQQGWPSPSSSTTKPW